MRINETSYQAELDEKKPVKVDAIKGVKSKPVTKKFKDMKAYEKWADSEDADDYTVQRVYNESVVPANTVRITESQLRKIVRTIISEQHQAHDPNSPPHSSGQSEPKRGTDIPVTDPSTISRGPTYGHTSIGVEYAPVGMSDEEARDHLRKRYQGAPVWKFLIAKDPNKAGRVYAYYEIDTSD